MRRYFGARAWDPIRGGEFWDTLPTFLHNLPLYHRKSWYVNNSLGTVGDWAEPARGGWGDRGNLRNIANPTLGGSSAL